MDTAKLIGQARRAAGLSQRALAERAGTSRHAISHYERGHRTPSIAGLTAILAAAGVQIQAELEPLDQDVRAAIARVAAEPMAERDGVSRWVWLADLSCCAYRVEGISAANMLGAPLPVDCYDLAIADTAETLDALATLVTDHAYGVRTRRDGPKIYLSRTGPGDARPGEQLRERLRAECSDGTFWLRSGFAEARVRLAPSEDVSRHIEVGTPHGTVRVAPLNEIEGTDPHARRVLRVLRESAQGCGDGAMSGAVPADHVNPPTGRAGRSHAAR